MFYKESVTNGQIHKQTDAGESDPYVPIYLADDARLALPKTHDTTFCSKTPESREDKEYGNIRTDSWLDSSKPNGVVNRFTCKTFPLPL